MKLGRRMISIAMRFPVFLAMVSQLPAATLTLDAVSDTSLFESKPDFNLGAATLVAGTNQQVSRSRAMFSFDLSSLPAGAVVTGVQVMLYCTRQPDPDQHGGPVASDFSLHRMLVSWGEGSGASVTGSVAMAGDATWNERHYQAISWGTPGGLSGTDFSSNPSATTSVGNVGLYVWGSSTELIDDVESWLADPSSNFGFMLMSQSENSVGSGRRFASTEQSNALTPPPQLVITYIPEPSVPALVMLGFVVTVLVRRRAICQ
ncbi:MAG: DNRLRE domain-containing protein [Luteolibacter sp.]|uniref:DNRLRE domain-containing protein n=1 Tax=Luteolibacter sp. TaxID=1962973 RepID=UPI003267B766